MTEAEAEAQAAAEGLRLVRSTGNATGFRGVAIDPRCSSTPFRAHITRGGCNEYFGSFSGAAEAALAYARALGPEGCAPAVSSVTEVGINYRR